MAKQIPYEQIFWVSGKCCLLQHMMVLAGFAQKRPEGKGKRPEEGTGNAHGQHPEKDQGTSRSGTMWLFSTANLC